MSPREFHRLPFQSSRSKASIPFEKQGQVVIVEATLNKKTAAKFVVDTGASYTMISSAVAKELDIDTEQNRRTAPFQTANGIIQAPLVSLESISVGGMEIRNLTAAVHDVLADLKSCRPARPQLPEQFPHGHRHSKGRAPSGEEIAEWGSLTSSRSPALSNSCNLATPGMTSDPMQPAKVEFKDIIASSALAHIRLGSHR